MHIEKSGAIIPDLGEVPPILWGKRSSGDGYEGIIVFHDPERFAAEVLPMFAFPPSSFKSFVRKMYRWGFQRAQPTGSDSSARWAFFCDKFRRGEFARLTQMSSVDSRPKKAARRMTALLAPHMDSSETIGLSSGTASSNSPSEADGLQGRISEHRKRAYDTSSSGTPIGTESVSVTESIHVGDADAATMRANSFANDAVQENMSKRWHGAAFAMASQPSEINQLFSVERSQRSAEAVRVDGSAGIARKWKVGPNASPSAAPETPASSGESEFRLPESQMTSLSSSPSFLQTAMLSRDSANEQRNFDASFPIVRQWQAAGTQRHAVDAGPFSRPVPRPLNADRRRASYPLQLASYVFQTQATPTNPYSMSLDINRELSLIQNLSRNNLLMSTHVGSQFPSNSSLSLQSERGANISRDLRPGYRQSLAPPAYAAARVAAMGTAATTGTNQQNPSAPAASPTASIRAMLPWLSSDEISSLSPEQLLALLQYQQREP
jgi:HSF-type DNA-binding